MIREDRGAKSAAAELFSVLTKNLDLERHKYLSLSLIRSQFDFPADDKAILDALYYLASERVHLLEQRFELFEDLDNTVPVEASEVAAAVEDGRFYHPDTGESVPNWQRRLMSYFVPTATMRQILK